jgi:hypothetical protein
MSREEACFIHNGEIYYRVGASEKDIDRDLQRMANDDVYDDFIDETRIIILAQMYLIQRQQRLIENKYCK